MGELPCQLDRLQLNLSNLRTAASDLSTTTKEFPERHQPKMGDSGEDFTNLQVLTDCSELISTVCNIAGTVGLEEFLRSIEEKIREDFQVNNEIVFNPQLDPEGTRISPIEVQNVSPRKVTQQTTVNRAKEHHSAGPTATKSVHKRAASVPNSAENEDLSTGLTKAKRSRKDSVESQTAQDDTDIGAVQLENLASSTTPLEVNSAEKQMESSKRIEETETSDAADDVRRLMSILSDLSQLQLDTKLPPATLPAVIEVMKVQLDNTQVLMKCHRLIDLYSIDHDLDELEPMLKRTLTEVLLAAVKFHQHDSRIVRNCCHSLWETIDVDDDRTEVDLYLGAIDFLLEIVSDRDNLTTRAIKSASNLLRHVAAMFDRTESDSIGQKFVEKICQSIETHLDKPEWYDLVMEISWECFGGSSVESEENRRRFLCSSDANLFSQDLKMFQLDKSKYVDVVDIGWDCLDWIFYKSVANRKRFVAAGGIRLIRLCYKKFKDQPELISTMTWMIKRLCEEKSVRQDLMADGTLAILWEIWRGTNSPKIRSNCAQIFTHFRTVSSAAWPPGHPSIEEVKKELAKSKKFGERGGKH